MPNINRPNLPYVGVARQNYNYFKLLTSKKSGVPSESLDGYFNFFTDQVNDIYTAIAGINVGDLPGINDPTNAGKLLTTNGAGTQSWTLVQSNNILPHSITNASIYPQTITASELAVGGIGANQLAPDCVTQIKILDFNVTANKIGPGAVTEAKIADDAVTELKIEDNAVTTAKILDANVTTDKILNANVTTAKIANDAVTTAKILDANVTTPKIADGAITLPKMAADVIKVAASKADQIAGTSNNVYTNPLFQQHHKSATKFWCSFDGSLLGTNAPLSGYNVTSVTRVSIGLFLINITIPFNASDCCALTSCMPSTIGGAATANIGSVTTSSATVWIWNINGIAVDSAYITACGFGLQ